MPFTPTPTSGDDVLIDTSGDDTVDALAGNDEITVSGGFDNVNGNTGRDRLIIDYSGATQGVFTDNNILNGFLAVGHQGRIWQGTAAFTVDFSGIEDFTITSGGFNDNITVGDGDDVINLGGGDDFANFGAGNDSGDGGTGTDGFSANMAAATGAISINLQTGGNANFSNFEYLGTLTTGSGNDTVVTRSDVLANETINTGSGTDTVTVARGFDTVNAGADRDRLIIDYSGAAQGVFTDNGSLNGVLAVGYQGRIWQGTAAFTVDFSGIEDFTITSGGFNDNITVGDGDDVINLGGGDDFANFGSGNDSGDGGTGTDGFSANLGSSTSAISINLQTGVSATFSAFEYLGTLTTGSGNDEIITRSDVLANETINTGSGTDTVTVARGIDTVNAGADRDRLIIDYSGAAQGVFTDNGSLNGVLAVGYQGRIWQGTAAFTVDFSGIEDFTITSGGFNDNITVGDGDDFVSTGAGDDIVVGAGGDDMIDGGDGNDTLNGGLGIDTLSYAIASAGVTVDLSATTQQNTFGAGLDTISGFEDIIGSAFDDTLFGTTGDNRLYGGDGNDLIDGGAGSNTLIGGNGTDTLRVSASGTVASISGFEAVDFVGGSNLTLTGSQFRNGLATNSALSGTGTITVNMDAGVNFLAQGMSFTSTVATVVNGTSGIDIIKLGLGASTGNTINSGDGVDQIRGSNGVDTINGGIGNDKIMGIGGADVLTGGAGNDQFRYFQQSDSGLGAAADRITDFTIGGDRLNFLLIDADAVTAGDQAFNFVGTAAFANTGIGQIRYQDSGADLLVQADVNGDGVADMEIILQGRAGGTLTAADFIL